MKFLWSRKRSTLDSGRTDKSPVLIYHHLAKTGGTSLRKVVQANYRGDALLELYGPNRNTVDWYRRYYQTLSPQRKAAVQCIAAHSAHYIMPVLDRPFRAFTLVRDPVNRVVSLYYFAKILARKGKGKGAEMGRTLEALGWSLQDVFVHVGIEQDATPAQRQLFAAFFNGQSRAILAPHLPVDDVMPFVAELPSSLAPYEARLDEIVGRFYVLGLTEAYEASVRHFGQLFGWQRLFFTHENRTRQRPQLQDLPDETLSLIRAFNQLDVRLHEQARAALANSETYPGR